MPPWQAAEPQKMRDRLQGQLEFEIGRQHPLFGTYPRVIGRRIDNDDVAALLHDGRYATIHLPWPLLARTRSPKSFLAGTSTTTYKIS